MKSIRRLVLISAGLLSFAGTSNAALIEMFDTDLSGASLDSIADAEAIIAGAGGADYTTNANFINFDGDSFPGIAFGAPPLDRFVMRVTGTLDVSSFTRLRMDHDDGFVVRLDGTDFFSFDGNTAPRTTYSGATAALPSIVDFEMIFWDQGGAQVARFGGTRANGGDYFAFIGDPVAVSAPGSLALLGIGLIGIAGMRRRRRQAPA